MGQAMICAPQPEAAEAGADILRAGGNAVDAAIACALVQGVVDPLMAGIAGFGSMGIYMPARGFHGYIDFHAPAPRAAIRDHEKADVPRFNGGLPSKDTTQISVVDRDGACVSMTHSLGMPSGVITQGLGFMYNGCMGVFDPRPGRVGSIAPGKARFSSICPSILFREGKPCLVIGAPGATQIAMGVLQAILNVIDFGMSMTEAVSAARFSATSNAIDVANRIPRFVTRALAAQGYEIVRSPFTFGFAAVHGIRVVGDRLDGAADPGHDGIAIAV
jgi:gamma-glutamyltranspeptidase/glutathione hydrolase